MLCVLLFVLCIRWKDGAAVHHSTSWEEISDKRSQLSSPNWKNSWVILSSFCHVIHSFLPSSFIWIKITDDFDYWEKHYRITLLPYTCQDNVSQGWGVQHVWSDYHIKDSFLLLSCILLQFALGMGLLGILQHNAFNTQCSPTHRAADTCPSAGNTAALQVNAVALMSCLFRLSWVCSLSFCHGDPSSIQHREEAANKWTRVPFTHHEQPRR